jgi:hypothetical protein
MYISGELLKVKVVKYNKQLIRNKQFYSFGGGRCDVGYQISLTSGSTFIESKAAKILHKVAMMIH